MCKSVIKNAWILPVQYERYKKLMELYPNMTALSILGMAIKRCEKHTFDTQNFYMNWAPYREIIDRDRYSFRFGSDDILNLNSLLNSFLPGAEKSGWIIGNVLMDGIDVLWNEIKEEENE